MPKKGQVLKKTGSKGALASTAQISTSSSDSEASRARTARENNDNNASGDGAVLVSHADVVELMATAADNAVFENFTCSSDVPPSTPKGRPKPVYCSELAGHPFAVQDPNGDGNCSHYEVVDARSPATLPMDSGPSSPLSRMSLHWSISGCIPPVARRVQMGVLTYFLHTLTCPHFFSQMHPSSRRSR